MGVLRLILALAVVAGHAKAQFAGFPGAMPAVDFFFVISGFYMAMVLNEVYTQPSPNSFYFNRILRLAPVYYLGVIFGLVVGWADQEYIFHILSPLARLYYVFENIFVFGQDWSYLLCLKTVEQKCFERATALVIDRSTWSLAPELCFYLIAPFVVRSAGRLMALLAISAVMTFLVTLAEFPIAAGNFLRPITLVGATYYFLPSTMIYFSLGALSYHAARSQIDKKTYAFLAAVFCLLINVDTLQVPIGQAFVFAAAVPVLFSLTRDLAIDRFIGEISYPVYILHMPLWAVIKPYVGWSDISVAGLVGIASIMAGALLVVLVERPISRFRHRLRKSPDVKVPRVSAGPVAPALGTAVGGNVPAEQNS
jgi:peptidoglycan/LPS O-acetylase OafA/YrhL